jgi:hypothetical protein
MLASNLMLINPALFIEKLAKYRDSLRLPNSLEHICNYVSIWDYPEGTIEEVILRKRINALASLNLPEHQELIDQCISSIEKKMEKNI